MASLRMLCGAMAGFVLTTVTSAALAQARPTRPIQTISPFSAGNANHIVARVVLFCLPCQHLLSAPANGKSCCSESRICRRVSISSDAT